MSYCSFHVQLIASYSHANTLLVSGLQEEQVYFIFLVYKNDFLLTVHSKARVD
jgi:hypothetical protein